MVIIYKTSLPTWVLAKMLVKIKHIGLVNVVADKEVVPECIQYQATAPNIAKKLKEIYTNESKIADIKTELRKVKTLLGEKGACARAAKSILDSLH